MAKKAARRGSRYLIIRNGKDVYYLGPSQLGSPDRHVNINRAIDEFVPITGDRLDGLNFALFNPPSELMRIYCENPHPGRPSCFPRRKAKKPRRKKSAHPRKKKS